MERYCIIFDGYIVNTIVWDGESEWNPPPGCSVLLETEALEQGLPYPEFPAIEEVPE